MNDSENGEGAGSFAHGTRVQRMARDAVVEPFAVHQGLDAIKKTRQSLESGMRTLSRAARVTGQGLQKAGSLARDGWRRSRGLRERLRGVLPGKGADAADRPRTTSPTDAGSGELAANLRDAALTLASVARGSWQEASRWAGTSGIGYLEQGFRLVLDRDGERWIVARARRILEREDIGQLEDVAALDFAARDRLIAVLYPYRHPALRGYMRALDQAFNVTLGATVASNIPFTGAAVGALNIVKTILKIGGRISTMAALYGRRVAGPDALFRVSARVLHSLEAWESDPDHEPLSPAVLDDLFVSDGSPRAFREMLEVAARKDAYVFVPGVGTVGLGKIPLDDYRLDVYVRRLAMNYFEREPLREVVGAQAFDALDASYRAIYRELMDQNAIRVLQQRVLARRPTPEASRDKWLARWRSLTGTDGVAEDVSSELDVLARNIHEQVRASEADADLNAIVRAALA